MPSRARPGLLTALTCAAVVGAGATPALADSTVQVSGPSGNGCTLQDAIQFANSPSAGMAVCNQPAVTGNAGTITINVPAGDYVLSSTLTMSSAATVVVNGAGSGTTGTMIDGDNSVEPIDVTSGQVTISGVRVENGYSGMSPLALTDGGQEPQGNPGGGIDNAGSLTLSGDVVTGNSTGAGEEPRCPIGSGFGPCGDDGAPGGAGGYGGGIFNTGSLTITNSTISNNHTGGGGFADPGISATSTNAAGGGGDGGVAGNGGGVYSTTTGSLQVTGSTITGNTTGTGGAGGPGGTTGSTNFGGHGGPGGVGGFGGDGAGIYAAGPTSITASTIAANRTGTGGAGGGGGTGPSGLGLNEGGSRGGNGGGLLSYTSSLTLQDSTIEGNDTGPGGAAGTGGAGTPSASIAGQGAGVAVIQPVTQPLLQDTIADNTDAGGVLGAGIVAASVELANSIVASNSPTNCVEPGVVGTTVSGSSTDIVFGDSTCTGFTLANPLLGPLTDNGGPTQTMALGPGSAALNFDPVNSCTVTADQRGITRPQPSDSGCDAGAYEHALPVVSAVGATAPTPTIATVTAQINPELSGADTSVVVEYGITSAYGSSASAQTIARGSAPVAFSASLSGLQPSTTYHYRVVATNGDPVATDGTPGQTVSADATFTTPAVASSPPPPPAPPAPPAPPVPAALAASVGAVSASGPNAKLTISCSGGAAGAVCSGPITLSSYETLEGRTILAVAASAKPGANGSSKASKTKKVSKRMTVASSSYALPSGQSTTISVSLNSTGRALLAQFYKLPVTVTVGGSTPATAHIGFSYPRIRALILYTARFNGHGLDTVGAVTISGIPKGAAVKFACQKGSCSPRSETFKVKKGSRLSLGATAVVLKPDATVAFEVTHAGQVGHVLEVIDGGDGAPQQSVLCLPPGAKRPVKCA